MVNPLELRLKPQITSEGKISNWKLDLKQSGDVLKEFSGKDKPESVYDVSLIKFTDRFAGNQKPLSGILTTKDIFGNTAESKEVPLNLKLITIQIKRESKLIEDKEIDNFSLILFDFDQADLNEINQNILEQFVRGRLKQSSQVEITGYADRTGDPEYNRNLALLRASATARQLDLTNASIKGIGSDELLYDNNYPEGRFYCRTVRITVVTPVEKR
jgi:outer membrane protein OmpA-like peptidoglycan-associated protein